MESASRSFVIPVLDFSPHSPFNIRTLLEDLRFIEGEVIVVFNAIPPFEELSVHPRITRFCFNSQNPGVSRSWAIGFNLASSDQVFFLNADLRASVGGIGSMSYWLGALPDALGVAPGGHQMDWANLTISEHFGPARVTEPVKVDSMMGYCFAIDRAQFLKHGMSFDPRYLPCFCEEWDLGMQRRVKARDHAFYAVPAPGLEHVWGVSQGARPITYFDRTEGLPAINERSARRFVYKWRDAVDFHPALKAWIGIPDSRP